MKVLKTLKGRRQRRKLKSNYVPKLYNILAFCAHALLFSKSTALFLIQKLIYSPKPNHFIFIGFALLSERSTAPPISRLPICNSDLPPPATPIIYPFILKGDQTYMTIYYIVYNSWFELDFFTSLYPLSMVM